MDYIVLGVVIAMVIVAIMYIVKQKKKGVACIGCPSSGTCKHHAKDNEEKSCSCHCES